MDEEPKAQPLKGTKFQILLMLLDELREDLWVKCKTISPEDFNNYFDTKYANFKQLCPILYRKSMDGSLKGEEYKMIKALAEDISSGRKTKSEADSTFAWWMADKYKIQERYGKKMPPASQAKATAAKKATQANSWLFD